MRNVGFTYGLLVHFIMMFASCGNKNAQVEKVNSYDKPKTAAQILGDSNYLAICYGGYRTISRDTQPDMQQIKDDLKILHALGIKILRTYNTKYDEIKNILQAITELQSDQPNFEMYVMLGVWIDCENAWTNIPNHNNENVLENTAEINRAVAFANQYPQIVKIISVGNEAMVKWATSYYVQPHIILKWVTHLQQLKIQKELPQELWITSSDNFASWGGGDTSYHIDDLTKLYHAVDFVSIHTYPMHDTHYNPSFWKLNKQHQSLINQAKIDTLMLRALHYAKTQYANVLQYMKSIGVSKPVHIGETGWASNDNGFYGKSGSRACDEYKSGRYYHLMRTWTNQEKITCFYFEAFDEKWKDANNPNGSENNFGLFTIEGKAKYAIWDMVNQGVFIKQTRDGQPIRKTYHGNNDELWKTVEVPAYKTN
ncbi:MAG: glycosyl hydrolase family 17 [Bacteroidota bacterium]